MRAGEAPDTFTMQVTAIRVALLLSLAGATASAQSSANSALLEAAKLGQVSEARALLTKGAPVDAGDRRGFTPLMWASAGGVVDLVRLLLENGAKPDRTTSDGTTALMLAAANGFVEVARALILRGANPNITRSGVTARQIAAERGQSGVVALLEQAETLGSKLLQATVEGHDAAVRQLLSSGAPANLTNARGATPLMIAARNGDLGILQALLSRGADASVRDADGKTVFDWAEASPLGKYVDAFLADRGVSREPARPPARVASPQVKASLRTLNALVAKVPTASNAVQSAKRRAAAALAQLEALSARWPAESPEDYRDNLAAQIGALDSAITTGDAKTLTAKVNAIADDLEAKLEHCNQSGGTLGGSVTVRARTLRGGAEIKSWQVFYMPRVFEAATSASPDLFPQLSSPTVDVLVPGRYVMWVRDPATTRVGERTIVKIGEGKKELAIDLPVPATPPR